MSTSTAGYHDTILEAARHADSCEKILAGILDNFDAEYLSVSLMTFATKGSDTDIPVTYVSISPLHSNAIYCLLHEQLKDAGLEYTLCYDEYVKSTERDRLVDFLKFKFGSNMLCEEGKTLVFARPIEHVMEAMVQAKNGILANTPAADIYVTAHTSARMFTLLRTVHDHEALKRAGINKVDRLIDYALTAGKVVKAKERCEKALGDLEEKYENVKALNVRLLESVKVCKEEIKKLTVEKELFVREDSKTARLQEEIKALKVAMDQLKDENVKVARLEIENAELKASLRRADIVRRNDLTGNDEYHKTVSRRVEKEHLQALKRRDEECEAKLNDLKAQYSNRLKTVRESNERRLVDLNRSAEDRIAEVVNRYEQEMSQLRAVLNESMPAQRVLPLPEAEMEEEEVALPAGIPLEATVNPIFEDMISSAYNDGLTASMKDCDLDSSVAAFTETADTLEKVVERLSLVMGSPSAPLLERIALLASPKVSVAAGGVDLSDAALDFQDLLTGLLGGAGDARV